LLLGEWNNPLTRRPNGLRFWLILCKFAENFQSCTRIEKYDTVLSLCH
jgi:hypothetical protein